MELQDCQDDEENDLHYGKNNDSSFYGDEEADDRLNGHHPMPQGANNQGKYKLLVR